MGQTDIMPWGHNLTSVVFLLKTQNCKSTHKEWLEKPQVRDILPKHWFILEGGKGPCSDGLELEVSYDRMERQWHHSSNKHI